ncbi:hypothetical protein E2C01_086287 [Portunus trituberculatus]|uniref:Uncharacterized protein n=1 Tax=Portunus trituberculatus TaxID=210409 RepID=A0A5B7J9W4_PORTR|nr:hypothetical protein [Portunus trituberculatus]
MSRCWRARTEASSLSRTGHRRLPDQEQDTTNLKTAVDKAVVWAAAHNAYSKQNSSGNHWEIYLP